MKKACLSHWFIHISFRFKMKLAFGILSPCLTHWAVGKYVPASYILWLWVETRWHNCLADSWPSISHTLKSPSEISRSGKSLGWDSLLGNQSPCLKWSQRASLSFYSICGHLTVSHQVQICQGYIWFPLRLIFFSDQNLHRLLWR